MDYEKAYKEALERAEKVLKGKATDREPGTSISEYIFPELAESGDEKFRKYILKCCEETISADDRGLELSMDTTKKLKSWLEKQGDYANFRKKAQVGDRITKNEAGVLVNLSQLDRVAKPRVEEQGEQKPADNLKPKFKVGDWVIDKQGIVHQIERVVENVTNHTFGYDLVGGGYFNDATEGVRLWSIEDAKDGDVLAAHECYVLFKEIDWLNIKCHCTYHYTGFNPSFHIDTLHNKDAFHPATKEQRDQLEKAMTDAGYKWNADEKKLEKIEQKPAEWEEDETLIEDICCYLTRYGNIVYDEDELEAADIYKSIDKLKSLRPQNKWKPSEEQMDALEYYATSLSTYSDRQDDLFSLLKPLKKLREE